MNVEEETHVACASCDLSNVSDVTLKQGYVLKFRNNGPKDHEFSFPTIYSLITILLLSLP